MSTDKEYLKYMGKKWLKRILVFTACGAMVLPMFGCSKLKQDNLNLEGTDKTSETTESDTGVSDSTIKLEYMNVVNDMDTYISLDNRLAADYDEIEKAEGLSDEEKVSKKNLATYDYVLNILQLASARLSSDIDTVYTHSDDYMSYLAMLQSFADSYTNEKEAVQDYIVNGKDANELKTYKALKILSNYYIEIYNNLQGNTSTVSNSNSDDKSNTQTDNQSQTTEQNTEQNTESQGQSSINIGRRDN